MVSIVPSDPVWPELFEQEAGRIEQALGSNAARIEHVGSTAIPGLPAKAFIDIQVELHSMHPTVAFSRPLEAIGYGSGRENDPDWWFFERDAEGAARGYHVHVIPLKSEGGRRTLAFRDYLRSHPDSAAEYEALKRALASRFAQDVLAYTEAKTPFIRSIEKRALGQTSPPQPKAPSAAIDRR